MAGGIINRITLYCIKLCLEWQQIFFAVEELLLAESGDVTMAGVQALTVQPGARSVDLVDSLAVDIFHLQLMGVSSSITTLPYVILLHHRGFSFALHLNLT
jgi:hypothetical protein